MNTLYFVTLATSLNTAITAASPDPADVYSLVLLDIATTSYQHARAVCQSYGQGGDLPILSSSDLWSSLVNWPKSSCVPEKFLNFYVGLTHTSGDNGVWKWVNGDPFVNQSYVAWVDGSFANVSRNRLQDRTFGASRISSCAMIYLAANPPRTAWVNAGCDRYQTKLVCGSSDYETYKNMTHDREWSGCAVVHNSEDTTSLTLSWTQHPSIEEASGPTTLPRQIGAKIIGNITLGKKVRTSLHNGQHTTVQTSSTTVTASYSTSNSSKASSNAPMSDLLFAVKILTGGIVGATILACMIKVWKKTFPKRQTSRKTKCTEHECCFCCLCCMLCCRGRSKIITLQSLDCIDDMQRANGNQIAPEPGHVLRKASDLDALFLASGENTTEPHEIRCGLTVLLPVIQMRDQGTIAEFESAIKSILPLTIKAVMFRGVLQSIEPVPE